MTLTVAEYFLLSLCAIVYPVLFKRIAGGRRKTCEL